MAKLVDFFILCLLINFLICVSGRVVKYRFEVSYISGSPDGVWTNHILGINGHFPGPTIEAEVGDILQITVVNKIQDGQNVTLHWHGIHQRGTPFEDGPSQITQCPIKSGSTQVYTFSVPIAGTYWYHSHVNSQYTEGLWGSLIVRGPQEVWNSYYDQEILITLNDWYHTSAHENEQWFLRPESLGAPPYPFSVLLNGVGRYPCDYARVQGRVCGTYSQKRAVYEVQPGKTYKLRLINTSGWVAFNFTVEGHTLRVIEVDGVETYSSIQDAIEGVYIGAGQRYSFLLTTQPTSKITGGEEFLIRANLRNEFLFTRPQNINPHPEAVFNEVTGVIRYTTSPASAAGPSSSKLLTPSFELFEYDKHYESISWNSLKFLNELTLLPFDRQPVPFSVDKHVELNITFKEDEDGIRRGSFNGRPFSLTNGMPELGKFVRGMEIPEGTYPVRISYGDVVQVVINNPEEGPHPIHLHGHHFWVVGMGPSGNGSYDPSVHELKLTGYRRDTAMVKEKSWLVIRFRADNVGVWTLHCHVDWHLMSGMSMTFVEAPELASSLRVPLEAQKVCQDHNVSL